MNEPIHPVLGKNPKFYSHKFQQAALLYELACSIYENKLVWMRGPFNASRHDIKFCRYRDEKAREKREKKKKKHEKACK